MVYRVYSEKKAGFTHEAGKLLDDARTLLGISGIESVRIINRYDVENITEELFDYAVKTVFSEPPQGRRTAFLVQRRRRITVDICL